MDLPKVSVVIPCFNHKEFIEQSINSVLRQTYTNLELIVIDDGSTDGSKELLKELLLRLNFTFIDQKNMGLSKTLNKAIRKFASGDYIALLASDDFFHPQKIEKQVMALQNSKESDFCYTQAVEFDSETKQELRVFPIKRFEGNVINQIILRQPYAAGSILFSRALYDSVDGFDESLKYEDWDFSIRCSAITKFTAVDEVLFYYRSHGSNVSSTMDRKRIFQQKMKTLGKNKKYVPYPLWVWAVFIHFLYDYVLYKLRLKNLKRFLH